MTEPTVFGSKATEQIAQTVREVARRTVNELPHRARWQHHGGNGGHHIWFTVVSVVCGATSLDTYVTATVTHYTGGCGVVPGEDAYGLVEIHQVCDIFMAYFTKEQLELGATGRATYMYSRDEYDVCTPEWIVDIICGVPICA